MTEDAIATALNGIQRELEDLHTALDVRRDVVALQVEIAELRTKGEAVAAALNLAREMLAWKLTTVIAVIGALASIVLALRH